MNIGLRIVSALMLSVATLPAMAEQVSFSNWKEQRLSLFSSNDYSFGAQTLTMKSDGAVSIAWGRVPERLWDATSASWTWNVTQSVPATDLSRKGGDDRNLSLYFVFLPEDQAQAMKGKSIRRLLGNTSVRIMQYAYGGNHKRGTVIKSPYGPSGQGVTLPLRQAGTGQYAEKVNLSADFKRAFGGARLKLVGLAVSGDSDDTDSVIAASLSALNVR